MKVIRRMFEHHAAMNASHCAGPLAGALGTVRHGYGSLTAKVLGGEIPAPENTRPFIHTVAKYFVVAKANQ